MTKAKLRRRRDALAAYLAEAYGDGVVMLDGPEFDGGIVGVAGGRLVYSHAKLAAALAAENRWTRDEALDWIDYNTMRSLPYMGENAPVVMEDLDPKDFENWRLTPKAEL